jgi:hypothetical protein
MWKKHPSDRFMDVPIIIYGTLHITPVREDGQLIGIYQMDADRIVTSSRF